MINYTGVLTSGTPSPTNPPAVHPHPFGPGGSQIRRNLPLSAAKSCQLQSYLAYQTPL